MPINVVVMLQHIIKMAVFHPLTPVRPLRPKPKPKPEGRINNTELVQDPNNKKYAL